MDQEQLADQYAGQQLGPDLVALDLATARVHRLLNDADYARSIIATLFWQAFRSLRRCELTGVRACEDHFQSAVGDERMRPS